MNKTKNFKAVVVLSGGQDSTLCLALAVKKYGCEKVAAVTFSYGQRHDLELKYAKASVSKFKIPLHKVIDLSFYKAITSNALLDTDSKITHKKGASAPTTFVDGRNMVFFMLTAIYAKSLGATEIWTGVSEADFSGYPDCRKSFIMSCQRSLRLAMEWPFKIVTPFMNFTKKDEWELADKLGIFDYIKDSTLTCYNGIPAEGCKKCPACKLRAKGLSDYLKSIKPSKSKVAK